MHVKIYMLNRIHNITVGLSTRGPMFASNLDLVSTGVEIGLQLVIPTLVRILCAYFSCDKNIESLVHVTEMPKK